MTQEEKELLLKDLCARLPYGVNMKTCHCKLKETLKTYMDINHLIDIGWLPYLRPMSSMTKEEIDEYHKHCEFNDCDYTGEPMYFDTIDSFDYLYSIHVDCRGLIPKSLALEAPEGMYKTE